MFAELPKQDIGQGIMTTFGMLVADNLDVPFETVTVALAPADQKWGAAQITGGSHNTRVLWDPVRVIGAKMRGQLLAAGSQQMGIPVSQLRTEDGYVVARDGQKMTYGELTATAAQLPEAKAALPKKASEFKIIGNPQVRHNIREIIQGKQQYSMDLFSSKEGPVDGRDADSLVGAERGEVGGEAFHRPALGHEVEFLGEGDGEVLDYRRGVRHSAPGRCPFEESGQTAEDGQVSGEAATEVRALDFHDYVAPVRQFRGVDLGDGCGRQRLGIEAGEQPVGRGAQLGRHDVGDVGKRNRRDAVETGSELLGQGVREQPGARGDELTQLHVGGPQLLEGVPQLSRRRPARGPATRPGDEPESVPGKNPDGDGHPTGHRGRVLEEGAGRVRRPRRIGPPDVAGRGQRLLVPGDEPAARSSSLAFSVASDRLSSATSLANARSSSSSRNRPMPSSTKLFVSSMTACHQSSTPVRSERRLVMVILLAKGWSLGTNSTYVEGDGLVNGCSERGAWARI